MERQKRILVAVLDWGLGHATRSLPLIHGLQKKGHKVFVASAGPALALLQKELQGVRFFALPLYNPIYPENAAMVWKMGRQLPHFIATIKKEHLLTEELVDREKVDVVISDNRYGCYSERVKSVFITHQLHLLMPTAWKWMEPGVNYFNHRQLQKYSECWVPANNAEIIPGLLKAPDNIKTRYIGYLSRFEKRPVKKIYKVVAIASGPEPQRSIFANILRAALKKSGISSFLVNGDLSKSSEIFTEDNLTEVGYLQQHALNELIEQAEVVICRSGYSSFMDLAKLGAKVVFIPTPGQTEQAYIADELQRRNIAFYMNQNDFDLEKALKEAEKYRGFYNFEWNERLLQLAIEWV